MGLRISWEDRREEIYEAYLRHGRNARQTARELQIDVNTVIKWAGRVEAERAQILDNPIDAPPSTDLAAQLAAVRDQLARLESQAGALATRQTSEPTNEGGQLDAPLPVTVIYPELARPVVAPPPPAIYRVTEFLKIVDDPEDDQGHEERFCYATGRMNQRILDALRRGGHWTE